MDKSIPCLPTDRALPDAGPDIIPNHSQGPNGEPQDAEGETRRKSIDVMDSILLLDLGWGTDAGGGVQVLGELCSGKFMLQ